MRRFFKIIFLLVIIFNFSAFNSAMADSCVNCHKTLDEKSFAGHKYTDWEGSIHKEKDVSCSKCHGGYPNETEKDEAHKGIYKSNNPKSRIYFQNIPETCGTCHTEQYSVFTRSEHYLRLESSGKGPNCVTCHGSMSISIIGINEMETFCSNCHNKRFGIKPEKPTEAKDTLLLLYETELLLKLTSKLTVNDNLSDSDKQNIQKAKTLLIEAKESWHSFNLQAMKGKIYNAYILLKNITDNILK